MLTPNVDLENRVSVGLSGPAQLKVWSVSLTAFLKPILAVLAVILFAINAYEKKDFESCAWFVLVVMWALG